MTEWLTLGLGVLLMVLAAVLSAVALAASRRFDDGKVALVGVTFAVLSVTGFLSILSEFFGFADEAFSVEPGPLILLVAAVGILYGAMFRGAPSPEQRGDG